MEHVALQIQQRRARDASEHVALEIQQRRAQGCKLFFESTIAIAIKRKAWSR